MLRNPRTVAALAEVFEVRHVLTHELPDAPVADNLDHEWLCDAASRFIEACEWVVIEELHGSMARSQLAMNTSEGERHSEVTKELKAVVAEAATLQDISNAGLVKVQECWQQFSEAEASLIASQVDGGSMYPMIWCSAHKSLSEDRVIQLRRMIDEWMDG